MIKVPGGAIIGRSQASIFVRVVQIKGSILRYTIRSNKNLSRKNVELEIRNGSKSPIELSGLGQAKPE